jgi:AcrR family transcriptional regulator
LVYNYFESKEEILVQLFNRFIELVSRLLNPDSDEEITNEEMELFFRNFTSSMNSDREYWMLYFQLSMQKSVLELIQRNILKGEMFVRYQQLTYKFFADRFPDPMPQMLFFSFLIKGFSIQYVLTPEFIPVDEIERFWNRMKEVFIVDKLPVAEQV